MKSATSMLAPVVLLALPLCAPQERAPGVKRLGFVLAVEHARARAAGWGSADMSDAQVDELAAKLVERRFLAMERAARVTLADGRIEVSLPSILPRDRELFEGMLKSLGVCELLFYPSPGLSGGLDLDLERERERLDTWRSANASEPLAAFHALAPARGGPHVRLLWVETDLGDGSAPAPSALLLPSQPEDHFGAASFARASSTKDGYGFPAVAVELHSARSDDFSRFTAAGRGERLGVVLEGKLCWAPTLETKLGSQIVIEGRSTAQEATRLAQAFTKLEGPLRLLEIR